MCHNSIENGFPAKIHVNWRLVPPDEALTIVEALSEITDDPNILPPEVLPSQSVGGNSSLYRPRISPRNSVTAPSMMMVMLRDFGLDTLRSGFVINEGRGSMGIQTQGPILFRQTVVFKHCAAIVDPGDMQRFVVITSLIPSNNRVH
jgi:hypothetical protein